MRDLKKETISINDIPFLKRWPYRDEKEYRYIFESDEEKGKVAIPIGLDDIISITFSEKMPEHTFSAIKGMIKFRYKISKIDRTTVYRNERWIEFIKGKSDA
jgi:predicted transglutaminase-like protease